MKAVVTVGVTLLVATEVTHSDASSDFSGDSGIDLDEREILM